MKNMIALLAILATISLVGCQEQYNMDETAQRCRDNASGQFVNAELCQ